MPTRPKAPVYRQPPSLDRLESENRRLRDELFLVRDSLIHLMDPQDLLTGHLGVRDDVQLDTWRRTALAAVMGSAQVRPGAEMGDPSYPRALCPLCRQGAQGIRDVRGYSVPGGLRRHLLGELNSRQCPVFKAAEAIALENIYDIKQGRPQPNWNLA
ncbi:hypothetical protein DF118_32325 [Burkholderia stagnalis]|uniref:hypothetical protein n=1 Tax=Burkholderia stagnalis TaxID=1503054 RepID=UPI000F5C4C49|nr:hypothetical protein [Burkholderia stagnalis]RQY03754.1 hypothetical protein DF118_32325 [Burkholderia stagnalis]RQY50965.1 hypothetical protein DF109_32440 [Burkholderia stagnalis]RQY86702.1 hypothetical protein DF108_10940 [Burkholderia stagnalis]